MEAAKDTHGAPLKILRREESLRSRQHRGVCVRVIYERDSLEVLRTEMEPGSRLENSEVGNFSVIHFVIDGSPVVSTARESSDLVPGDSVVLGAGNEYTIANRTSSRSVILSILFKSAEEQRARS